MENPSEALNGKVLETNKPFRFFFFGGWCPHLTSLLTKEDGISNQSRNYEDVHPVEEVSLYLTTSDGLVRSISCGIPEFLFANAAIEWGPNNGGIFLMKMFFTSDYDQKEKITEDASLKLNYNFIKIIAQNIIYKEIKNHHHIHTHHDKEEDNLLTLWYLGEQGALLSLKDIEVRQKIIKHFYSQYSNKKPNEYTNRVKKLLGENPKPKQLEEAVKLLYKGIGEASFGIAFLGMHGSELFTDSQINKEHIKLESAMRSLEALKGRYTFDFMKSRRQMLDLNELVKNITEGVTNAILEKLKN